MSDIVIYNPSDPTVPNKVTNYLRSVNSPDYDETSNKLINPDLTAVQSLDYTFWKVQNNEVFSMTTEEQQLINNIKKAKTFRQKKYFISTYSNYSLQSEIWYETENNGEYENKVQEINYTYSNNYLVSKTTTNYFFDGTICNTTTENYFSADNTMKIVKIQ
jgi:hypothetical protein